MWVGLLGGSRRLGRFMTLFAHKWSQAGFRVWAPEGRHLAPPAAGLYDPAPACVLFLGRGDC